MKQTLPWNVTGIPPEARDVARAFAQREGITVGEWLTRCILKEGGQDATPGEQAQTPPPPHHWAKREDAPKDGDELAAAPARSDINRAAVFQKIYEALGALSQRIEAGEAAQREAQQTISTAANEIHTATREQALGLQLLTERIEAVEYHADPAPLREAVRGVHQGLERLAEEIAKTADESSSQITAIANNVEELAGKLAKVHDESRETAKSADARIAGFETRLKQSAQEAAAVLELQERLTEVKERVAATASTEELEGEIQARISFTEKRMQESIDRHLAGFERMLENLGTRLAKESASQFTAIANNVEELAGKLADLGEESRETAKSADARIANFETRLKQSEQESAAVLELQERLNELKARIAAPASTEALEAKIQARISVTEKRMQEGLDQHLAGFERMLENLGTRLANESASQITAIADNVEELAGKVATVHDESRETAKSADARIADLKTRLAGPASTEEFEAKIQARISVTEKRMQESLDRHLAGFERMLENLGARLANESASQITAIANNVEELAGKVATVHEESRETAKSADARIADFEMRLKQSEQEAAAVLGLQERLTDMKERIAATASTDELEAKVQSRMSFTEKRMQENLERHLASFERMLENLGTRLDKAEAREDPASTIQEAFRTLGARLEITEKRHRGSLADIDTKLAGIANRIGALETAPKPEARSPAFAPLEALPFADVAPFTFKEATEQEDEFSEDEDPELLAYSSTENYLARARRATQTGSEAEPEPVNRRGESADGFASASGKHDAIRRAAKPVILAVLVLFVIATGLQLSGMLWRPPSVAALQLNKGEAGKSIPASIATASQSGAPDDDDATKARLTAQAEAGDAKAALVLGLKYANGDGASPSDAEAARWLLKAAQAGEAVAEYRLGTFYEKGRGVEADPKQAIHWYSEAAKAGNRKAMHNLAVAYANGTGGQKNLPEAVRWFQAAAELGMTDSQFNLAVLYERGLGVKASLPDAYRWYVIAAAAGDAESKARAEALATQITAKEREAADKTAVGYKPRPMNLAVNDGP